MSLPLKPLMHRLPVLLCAAVCLCAASQGSLKAQQVQKIFVNGQDGKTGTAQYSFKKGKNGQVILDGSYNLELHSNDSSKGISFIKDKWSGNFREGRRGGSWTFTEYEHQFNIKDIENFQAQYVLESMVRQLTGSYKDGYPTDQWTYENMLYRQGEKVHLLAQASMTFTDGKVSGPFYFNTPGDKPWLTVDGTIGQNGLMENLWTFKYTTADSTVIEEYRNYQNGFLLSLVKKIAGTGDTLQTLTFEAVNKRLTDPDPEVRTTSKNFGLSFDLGYDETASELTAQHTANERLTILLKKLADMDTALSHHDHLKIGTAKFEFEISEEQKRQVRSIQRNIDSLFVMTETVVNYPILRINNQHTDSLAAAYQFFNGYAESLPDMQKLVTHLASEKIRYTDPDIFIRRFHKHLAKERKTTYVYKGKEKTQTLSYHTQEIHNIGELDKRLREELAVMNQLYQYVKKEIHNIVQSERLSELENEIAKERRQFDSAFTSVRPQSDHARNMINYLHSTFSEQTFVDMQQAYASSENFSEKSDLAIKILTVLKTLKSIPPQIINIFEQQEAIREAYTETRFDPYTFTNDFKVIRKRRLYDKAAVELYNHMLNTLRAETDHTHLGKHIREIKRLQGRLLELLEEDTRRLERKIRQKKNPEEIKRMLNL